MVVFCFSTGLAALAAEAPPAPAAPAHRATLVVRADPRTGKLVRSVVVNAKPAAKAQRDQSIDQMVDEAAQTHKVDPLLVRSMIKVESNGNPYAISSKGAEGLMQLMPPTARGLGVANSFDPRQNIEAGVRYLKYLQELYKDDRLALAAYNAGPAAVKKYGWIPPYAETQNYVYQVGKKYGEARRSAQQAEKPAETGNTAKNGGANTARNGGATGGVTVTEPRKVEQYVDKDGRLHLRTK